MQLLGSDFAAMVMVMISRAMQCTRSSVNATY